MRCLKPLLLILTTFFITDISAKIYICVDDTGKRQYSDKRCPIKSGTKTESFSMTNRVIAPSNVIEFTAVLKLSRESLALLMVLEPNDSSYGSLYKDISNAQINHRKFLANPQRQRFRGYNPMGVALQNRLIASMSNACRKLGHMSICGAIEGNSWFSTQEADFLQGRTHPRALSGKFCDKAGRAHVGGVISNQMRISFCQSGNTN